jgi:nucleotide-binding universal stress UspA family protein
MTTGGTMREILLHGGSDEAFDRSAVFARRLAESFGAKLHVVYTVEDPLSAGWTAEMGAERLPEVHQAIEAEARDRLARLIPMDEQARLNVEIVVRTGEAGRELVRYTRDANIDLAIVTAAPHNDRAAELARALLDHGRCAVLVLR